MCWPSHDAAGEAVRRARQGGGPTLLECKTYRTRPHAEGMGDFTYRTREEVEEWKTRCPIARFATTAAGVTDRPMAATELTAIEDGNQARVVADAQQFAETQPLARSGHGDRRMSTAGSRSAMRDPRPRASVRERRRTRRAKSASCKRRSKRCPRRWPSNPTHLRAGRRASANAAATSRSTAGLYDLYGPERLCDTPICERGFVGLGCGAAMTGTRPVIDFMFADFVLDAVGEIVNQIAKMQYMSSGRLKMPILLRGCIGIGHSAATHHSGNYYPMYAHFPGLRVVVPSTPVRCQGAAAPRPALRRSGALPGTSRAARRQGAGAGRGLRDPLRPGGGGPRRQGCHRGRPGADGARRP